VRRLISSSLLSLLLVTVLVWGGCISCEQYFMWPGAKTCCAPDGHCKTKAPAKQASGPECKQIAFDHHEGVDLHVDFAVVAMVPAEAVLTAAQVGLSQQATNDTEPPGPDLQILHSAFLI